MIPNKKAGAKTPALTMSDLSPEGQISSTASPRHSSKAAVEPKFWLQNAFLIALLTTAKAAQVGMAR